MVSITLKKKVEETFNNKKAAEHVLDTLEMIYPNMQDSENTPFVNELLSLSTQFPARSLEALKRAIMLITKEGIDSSEYLNQLMAIAKNDVDKFRKIVLLERLYLVLEKSKFTEGWEGLTHQVFKILEDKNNIYKEIPTWENLRHILSFMLAMEIGADDTEYETDYWLILLKNISNASPEKIYSLQEAYHRYHDKINTLSCMTAIASYHDPLALAEILAENPFEAEETPYLELITLLQNQSQECSSIELISKWKEEKQEMSLSDKFQQLFEEIKQDANPKVKSSRNQGSQDDFSMLNKLSITNTKKESKDEPEEDESTMNPPSSR